MYDVGDTVVLEVTPKDQAGFTVAPTAVAVTLPDGTTSTPAFTGPDPDGQFTADFTTTLVGTHRVKWVGPGFAQPSVFTVWPEMGVLSLDDAKEFLNITTTIDDEELRLMIAKAETAVASRCGPLVPTTITKRVSSYGTSLALPVWPVISVTSIADTAGTAVDVSTVDFSPTAGILTFTSQWATFSASKYDVTWVAGRQTLPADLYGVVQAMLKHMWSTQRGGSSRPARAAESQANTLPGSSYFWPYAIEQAMTPFVQLGIA